MKLYTGVVIELDEHRPHLVGWSTCKCCGHRVVSVVDARADLTRLECSRCHAFDSDWEPDES